MRASRTVVTVALAVALGALIYESAAHNITLTRAPAHAAEARAINDLRGKYHEPRSALRQPDEPALLVPAAAPPEDAPRR